MEEKKVPNIDEGSVDEDALTELSMQILIHAGNARDETVNGLTTLEDGKFVEAAKHMQASRKEIVVAHGLQTSTLQKEAEGINIRYSPLFCHAQDTLMTAQSELLIAEHLVKLFKRFEADKEEAND